MDKVRRRVAEIIDLADHDALDLSRSRAVERELLDLLDEPASNGWVGLTISLLANDRSVSSSALCQK